MRRRSRASTAARCLFPTAPWSWPTTATSTIRSCCPKSQVAAGYPAIMPSFAGQISEDDVLKLVAYIRSLGDNKEIGQ